MRETMVHADHCHDQGKGVTEDLGLLVRLEREKGKISWFGYVAFVCKPGYY